MSYDLKFYKKTTNTTSKSEIEEYFLKIPNLKNSEVREGVTEWIYDNEDTGAYFWFQYWPGHWDDYGNKEEFDGFENTRFAFKINFQRPHFFGKEGFLILNRFVEEFDLYIFNPNSDIKAIPRKYGKGVLEKEWAEANTNFSMALFNMAGLSYIELEKSNNCWEFNFNKNELQSKLGKEYVVPNIYYFKRTDSNVVETLCTWNQNEPFVLPKVDYVQIGQYVSLFREQLSYGFLPYSDFISQVGEYFREEGEYNIIHPKEATQIAPSLKELKLARNFGEIGGRIEVEKIANVKAN